MGTELSLRAVQLLMWSSSSLAHPDAAELLCQVAALEATSEGERDRRREVEAALQVWQSVVLSSATSGSLGAD